MGELVSERSPETLAHRSVRPHELPDAAERELLGRVLDALLREDAYRLRSTAHLHRRPDGDWLALRAGERTICVPVTGDGHRRPVRVRRPLLETAGATVTRLGPALAVLRAAAGPHDQDGFDAFAAECAAELAALRLHERLRDDVAERLAAGYGTGAAAWKGPRGALAFGTLAASRPDPLHPAGRARSGLAVDELPGYAPEFHPGFGLRWLALPHAALRTRPTGLPAWWPAPDRLGLPELTGTHTALPVHPLTAGEPLARALRAAGLQDVAHLAVKPWLDVVPTLPAGTVAPLDDPAVHLELPLAERGIASLPDRAVGQRLLEEVLAREPRLAPAVLLADERTHLDAGRELLAALVRRRPDGLTDAHVVPVAALSARTPDGVLVADALADRYYGGSLHALLDAYFTLLLDWHTTLFAYGVAPDSHQRNVSLVLDEHEGRPRLRLLQEDHAGLRVNAIRLVARLGGGRAADLLGFADRRVLVGHDGPVADLFTAAAVHLCAAAPAGELAGTGRGDRATWLRLLRTRLAEAADRLPSGPAAVLRTRVLEAGLLPVRTTVTAGADGSGRRYVNGPNYLLEAAR
ncbi:IucA/IucC family siderophore biosynthesis protein [Streptomyces sp. AV19]|uniref:IucA/IucC family protein n=1 Tax=Streptomyces sp. AV19 TaxID=2793068 RepID=UPI0018FEF7AB|nr:IucA/IucC family protein [Streptomyces sp. AV19]MBH1936585.1 IucA/IucC family siderophore biosynthesis protein [Streptomyces sp. AV19]MDG4532645.1 IucA/IucC family protein [Streptomyces sp. AV19]